MSKTKKKRRKPLRQRRLPRGPNGGIQLLLIQNVEPLGKQGDIVEVRPGYANNYLLPQGLATIATEHHKRMIENHRARLQEIERARLASLRAEAERLSQQSVTIEANATDEGHLYGSVGPNDIAKALKAQGFHVAPEQVRLQGPLKELGLYTVKVHLGQEIEAEVNVWVVPAVGQEPSGSAEQPAAQE